MLPFDLFYKTQRGLEPLHPNPLLGTRHRLNRMPIDQSPLQKLCHSRRMGLTGPKKNSHLVT